MHVLREAFDYPFSRLDPMGAHIDPPSIAVYDTLLVKGHDRLGHPSLARVADVSADGLEWTLQLREGASFHSGAVCDAKAVVDSLEALRWHVPGDRQLWYWDPVDRVEPVDHRTIRFTLHHPYSRLPALLWGTHTAVFNRAAQLAHPDEFGVSLCDGTGPFRVESVDADRIVATRVGDYPSLRIPGLRAGSTGLDRIEWFALPDPAERWEALRSGGVDCLHGVDYAQVQEVKDDPRFHVYEAGQASSMYLSLNWERRDLGFHDVRLRRALSSAIDRDRLVRDGVGGHGRPTWGPVPPGTQYYDAGVDAGGAHDVRRAEHELNQLGWRRGPDGLLANGASRLSFECVVQDDPVFAAVASLVAHQLRALGVELRIRYERPFAAFYDACAAGPASSISKWLWQDPLDAVIGFSSTSTSPFPNWSRASVPDLDRCFDAWLHAESDEELARAAGAVQRVFATELPYIPLLSPNDVWAWRTEVVGFVPSPDILYPLYQGVTVATAERGAEGA